MTTQTEHLASLLAGILAREFAALPTTLSVHMASDVDVPDIAARMAAELEAVLREDALKWPFPPRHISGMAARPDDSHDVDPWKLQRELMRISGQQMPTRLELNAGALMYFALQCEELGEQAEALHTAVSLAEFEPSEGDVIAQAQRRVLQWYGKRLYTLLQTLQSEAKQLRQGLKFAAYEMATWHYPLTLLLAKPLVDGATDSHVVTCGFELSCGIPGPSAFEQVVTSNLSKANPETGRIDKEEDGKWIKGAKFVEPDLQALLSPLCQQSS